VETKRNPFSAPETTSAHQDEAKRLKIHYFLYVSSAVTKNFDPFERKDDFDREKLRLTIKDLAEAG